MGKENGDLEGRIRNKKKRSWWMASIFMHADAVDKFLMTLGFIGAMGDGLTTPLVLVVSSRLMNNIGVTTSTSVQDSNSFQAKLNMVPFPLL